MIFQDFGVVPAVKSNSDDFLGVTQHCLPEEQLREASLYSLESLQMEFAFEAVEIRTRRADQAVPSELLVLMRVDSKRLTESIFFLEVALAIERGSLHIADCIFSRGMQQKYISRYHLIN